MTLPLAAAAPGAALQAPSLRRRFASLVYEVLVCFGVALVPGAIGALLLGITGEPQEAASRFIAFLIFGAYFTWFWTRRGQTLPMQTWHMRLVAADGGPVSFARAAARYLAACAWVAPAVALSWANGWTRWQALAAVGAGVVAYGALARLHPQGQFLHDALCGTRLIDAKPAPRPSTR